MSRIELGVQTCMGYAGEFPKTRETAVEIPIIGYWTVNLLIYITFNINIVVSFKNTFLKHIFTNIINPGCVVGFQNQSILKLKHSCTLLATTFAFVSHI